MVTGVGLCIFDRIMLIVKDYASTCRLWSTQASSYSFLPPAVVCSAKGFVRKVSFNEGNSFIQKDCCSYLSRKGRETAILSCWPGGRDDFWSGSWTIFYQSKHLGPEQCLVLHNFKTDLTFPFHYHKISKANLNTMPIISLSFWPHHSKLTWCSSIPLICIQCSSSWSRTWCSSPSWALSSFSLSRSPTLLFHSSSCPSSHRPTCTKAFSVFSLFWERLNGTRGLLLLRKCHFLSLIPSHPSQ